MMSETKGVLLVPADSDPLGLLAEGPCGARPPAACWDGDRWRSWADNSWWWPLVPDRRALVLAWEGEPVAEGMAALGQAWGFTPTALPWWVRSYLRHRGPETVVGLAGWLLRVDCPGTIILIDGDGREVTNDK